MLLKDYLAKLADELHSFAGRKVPRLPQKERERYKWTAEAARNASTLVPDALVVGLEEQEDIRIFLIQLSSSPPETLSGCRIHELLLSRVSQDPATK